MRAAPTAPSSPSACIEEADAKRLLDAWPAMVSGDPYGELKTRVQRACIPKLGPRLFGNHGVGRPRTAGDRSRHATSSTRAGTPLAQIDRERLIREITADILGYGPLEPFLADDTVTEVMVNGYDRIYVERDGKIEPTDAAFVDDDHLLRIIDKIVSQVGRRVDEARRWSTLACPTAAASTRSSRRSRSTARR